MCRGTRSDSGSKRMRRRTRIHRLFDHLNIRIRCAFDPRGVHAQHHLDAVAVLFPIQSIFLPSMSSHVTEEWRAW